jgi:hypothetical protein
MTTERVRCSGSKPHYSSPIGSSPLCQTLLYVVGIVGLEAVQLGFSTALPNLSTPIATTAVARRTDTQSATLDCTPAP